MGDYIGSNHMESLNGASRTHKITMTNRKSCLISGVNDVVAFDADEILLDTDQGKLTIKGDELHVNRLMLDKGEVDVDGKVDSLTYSEMPVSQKGGESILSRIFK